MAIKISVSDTLSNDPSGDQEGKFRTANYGPVSSFPSSATEGDIGYANDTLYVFNGISWVDFDNNTSHQLQGGSVLTPGDGYEYRIFSTNAPIVVSGGDFNVDLLLLAAFISLR